MTVMWSFLDILATIFAAFERVLRNAEILDGRFSTNGECQSSVSPIAPDCFGPHIRWLRRKRHAPAVRSRKPAQCRHLRLRWRRSWSDITALIVAPSLPIVAGAMPAGGRHDAVPYSEIIAQAYDSTEETRRPRRARSAVTDRVGRRPPQRQAAKKRMISRSVLRIQGDARACLRAAVGSTISYACAPRNWGYRLPLDKPGNDRSIKHLTAR